MYFENYFGFLVLILTLLYSLSTYSLVKKIVNDEIIAYVIKFNNLYFFKLKTFKVNHN